MPKRFESTETSGMATLSTDMLIELVRVSIKSKKPIDARYFDEEIRELTAPFENMKDVQQIIEDEILEVNTVSLPLDEYDIEDTLIGQDLGDGATWSSYRTIGKPGHLRSISTGRALSDKLIGVKHLEVRLAIDLLGGRYNNVREWDRDFSLPSRHVYIYLASLNRIFPKLKTLGVVVTNQGKEAPSQWPTSYSYKDGKRYYEPSKDWDLPGEHWDRLKRAEMLMQTHAIVMMVAGVFARTLTDKSITFVQDDESTAPVVRVSGDKFIASTALTLVYSGADRLRAALLFAEIMQYSNEQVRSTCIEEDEEQDDETAFLKFCNKGTAKADLEFLERILDAPRARVEFTL